MAFNFKRPYLATRVRSKRSEQRAADIFNGRRQPNSGAVNRFDLKGDVKSAHFLIEDKTTDKGSYSISLATWRTLSNHAWRNKRRPVLRVEFTGASPLYVIDEVTLLELLETFNPT
jgi:hypothetical protein